MQEQDTKKKRTTPGIEARHSRSCRTRSGGRCSCAVTYRAWVWDRHTKKILRKNFKEHAEAKAWRAGMAKAAHDGTLPTPTKRTIRQAADELIKGLEGGSILTRGGVAYKPSVIHGYRAALNSHIVPTLGPVKLSDLKRGDVQRFVDRFVAERKAAAVEAGKTEDEALSAIGSTIRNLLMPLRVLYREAGLLSPVSGVKLPAANGRRERVVSVEEGRELIDALPERDRALWSTALYAGLRRGELRGLRWEDADLDAGIIRVERSIDGFGNVTSPKSAKGKRTVPIVPQLRAALDAHAGPEDGLVFGSTATAPFTPTAVRKRALTAWKAANVERAKRKQAALVPVTLHELRHSFVSLMFDAGLSLERIGDYVGHSSSFMVDHYRHLLEGHEAEAAKIFGDYLARADTGARIEQLDEG
jgi:integrase